MRTCLIVFLMVLTVCVLSLGRRLATVETKVEQLHRYFQDATCLPIYLPYPWGPKVPNTNYLLVPIENSQILRFGSNYNLIEQR